MKTVSASSYMTYDRCPLQWHYKYNLRLLEKKSKPLLIGSAYHSLLEDFYNGRKEEVSFKRHVGHMDEEEQILLRGMFDKYKQTPVTGTVIKNEFKFNIEVPGLEPRLVGYVDRIDEDKIVEYKTSSKDYKIVDTETIQPDIYIYAAWKEFGILKDVVFAVNNKKKFKSPKYTPQQIRISRTLEDMKALEQKLIKFVADVELGEFPATPGSHCYWCPFGNKSGDGCCHYSR